MGQAMQRRFWAYRLRQLKQADWSDHDLVVYLSKVLREKESICAEYLSGRREPERERQLVLGQLIKNQLKRQERSIMRAIAAADEAVDEPPVPPGVYQMPFLPSEWRGLYMVADDGALLVKIEVHARAQEKDLVPGFRAWRQRIMEKEARQPLELLTPADAGEKVS